MLSLIFCLHAFLTEPTAVPAAGTESTNLPVTGTDVVHGLYPVWENTGYALTFKQARLALFQSSIGVGPNVQLSLRPWSFIMRAPNFSLKYGAYQKNGLHLSVNAGLYAILSNASNAFYSAQYAAKLENQDDTVMAVPVGASLTWEATSWLRLHNSLTLLGVFADSLNDQVFVGNFLMTEFKPTDRHSVFLHTGEVGFWDHDMFVLGLSYRYNYHWFTCSLGYFYRFSKEGAQSQPLFDIGIIL